MRLSIAHTLRCAIALILSASSLDAQERTTKSKDDPRPVAKAAARVEAITIDGRIDEAGWNAAQPITEFHQQQPDEGKAPTERTELRILYDASAVYIAARMFDSQGAAAVRKLLVRRDQLLHDNASDKIALVFDPYRDRTSRVWFELNPLGVKGDHLNGDPSFDPVWEGRTSIDSLGWSAEFRIPLSQMRFPRDSVQSWGLQVWRTLARRNESNMWAFWRSNEPGGPAYFGSISDLVLPEQPKQLELMPYAVSKSRFALAAPGDPFRNNRELTSRVGADARYNITSSLTLDATVNPDFGQVEVDPAVVNLSDFETTFQEKRPFFVANSGAFSYGSFNCFFCSNSSSLNVFYSRRIGRAPQLGGLVRSQASFADIPDASTILGAAKITGRTSNGLSVAMLQALTNRVTARYVTSGAPGAPTLTREAEPMTNYFVGRVRKDLRRGDTRVGMITTNMNRFMSDSTELSRLRARASTVGADIQHFWANRRFSFLGQAAVSDVGGDTAAMRRTQLTSAHYFQRPDRQATSDGIFDIRYNPTRTALRGYALYGRLAKESGNWLFETAQNWRSPGFEVNDMGTLARTDYKWMQASVLRQWTTPGRWYREAAAIAATQQSLNYDGDRIDLQTSLWGRATFHNYMWISTFAINRPSSYDGYLTRGGVMQKTSGYNFFSASFGGDSRQAIAWDGGASHGRNILDHGWNADGYGNVILKPAVNLRVSVGPSYSRSVGTRQYVTTVPDAAVPQFGNQRNVFALLDQHSLSMNTRINATFTPNLTLELFAQPFFASGDYGAFRQFAAARTHEVLEYGRDVGTVTEQRNAAGNLSYRIDPDGAGAASSFVVNNPDFNVRSLRGTAVMRWEYRPGSTVFFVWTQERAGSEAHGDFDFGRDRSALFRDRPINVFQIKASYWLGI